MWHAMEHKMEADHMRDRARMEAAHGHFGHAAAYETRGAVEEIKAFGAALSPFSHGHHHHHHGHGPHHYYNQHQYHAPGVTVFSSQQQSSSVPYYAPQYAPQQPYYPPPMPGQAMQTTITTYPAAPVMHGCPPPYTAGYSVAPGVYPPPPCYHP